MPFHAVKDIIKKGKKVIAFSGAGVSVESGIPDFRSADGIWQRYPVQEYGTIGAFIHDPVKFWNFYMEIARSMGSVEPNPGHRALAWLEQNELLQAIITQNIDGLHQKAGNINVIEVHGHSDTLVCLECKTKSTVKIAELDTPPHCHKCNIIMKPDIVLFGETLPAKDFYAAQDYARQCDVCLIVGTSCDVYPAASIPEIAYRNGATLCQFDLKATSLSQSGRVTHFIQGKSGETLPQVIELLKEEM